MNIAKTPYSIVSAILLLFLATRIQAGISIKTLHHDGLIRSYIVYRPKNLKNIKLPSLVIVMHGGWGNAESIMRETGMNAEADERGFIAVYPNGTGRPFSRRYAWNSWNCCWLAKRNNVDDVGFIHKLIDKMISVYHVNPKRVYVTGMSNGGMMAYKLVCELSYKIGGAAPVAGALNGVCRPKRPIPMVIFHGIDDEHLPYHGGTGKKSIIKRIDNSVANAVDFWVRNNRCKFTPAKKQKGNVIQHTYTSCKNNATVRLYSIKQHGHAWPGGQRGNGIRYADTPTIDVSATKIMVDFFMRH